MTPEERAREALWDDASDWLSENVGPDREGPLTASLFELIDRVRLRERRALLGDWSDPNERSEQI